MDDSWSYRRKKIYLGVIVLLLTSFSFLFFFRFWYQEPTCFDGRKNGSETGVDCGGSCALICKAEAIPPIVRWDPRMFEVLNGLWSAVVYVDNPNINADAVIKYKFTIYGNNNSVITEREGLTPLPKNKTVGVFEGSIQLGDDRPTRAVFEIDDNIIWRSNLDTNNDLILIRHSPILRPDTMPRVEAEVTNNYINDINNIELVAVVFDSKDNAIAASRTFIEKIKKDEKKEVFFTWPAPFELGTRVCQKPSDIMLAIDRSGSMMSISKNPPEPLGSVKNAASLFVESLSVEDRVGVVSFASEASSPLDVSMSNNIDKILNSIKSISIKEGVTQYTNMYDALRISRQELLSYDNKSAKVIILLTDGVANYPKGSNSKSENDDIKHAENIALEEANTIKNSNMTIYTIGLGDDVNSDFLKKIASTESHYFSAPSVDDLKKIYSTISSSICKELPSYIEVTYKILN